MRSTTHRRFPVRIVKLLIVVIIIWIFMWVGFIFISSPHVSESKESIIDMKLCPTYSSENNVFSNFTTSYGQYFPTQEHLELIEKHRRMQPGEPDPTDFIMLEDIRVVIFVHIYKSDRYEALKATWLGTFTKYYPNVKIVTFSSTIRQTEKFINSNNAVHKLVEIMRYGLEKYPNYDFYLKFDDDAYVYPHRLMYFLTYGLQKYIRSPDPFFGGFKGVFSNKYEFLCGGSGYVFNSAAFEKIRDCSDRPMMEGFGGAGMLEDVYFSHWMHYRCGVPMTFFTAFMLGWPEIVMKNFDVKKFTVNHFPLDLPITYHYITPYEMTNFLETRRLIPKIIYIFEEDPQYSIGKTQWLNSNCYHMISETNQIVQNLRIKKQEKIKQQQQQQQQQNENENEKEEEEKEEEEIELLSEEEKKIKYYLEEQKYIYSISNSSHALKTSEPRFPELVIENIDDLIERHIMSGRNNNSRTFFQVNPVLKFMMLYNTGGIYIHPSLDCRIHHRPINSPYNNRQFRRSDDPYNERKQKQKQRRNSGLNDYSSLKEKSIYNFLGGKSNNNILEDILITAYEMDKEVVVYIDQRIDEILFLASVKRSDTMLLILRDALFESQFNGFDMGEKNTFQRLFHYYGKFMSEKVLMLSNNVNLLFQCNNQEGVLEEV